MRAALRNWPHASTDAAVTSRAFIWRVSAKKGWKEGTRIGLANRRRRSTPSSTSLATSIAAGLHFFQRLLGRLVLSAVGRMRKLTCTKHFAALHRATGANA